MLAIGGCSLDVKAQDSNIFSSKNGQPATTEQKLLAADQIESISLSRRGLWDEGHGYYSEVRITIYPNGRIISETLYKLSNNISGVDIPEDTFEEYWISEEDFIQLIELFNQNRFLELPDDLTDYGICDGDSSNLEIITKTETYWKGGQNPTDERYLACEDAVFAILKNCTNNVDSSS